ncbi:hypothetical protein FOZ63_031383 [Perkinsus olseni]|uniref:Uncharacterized protein n=1 Tax=Perkinsus olseni TaxID=32597 RepID=A0A7J6TIV7_PEROL|nr:hypothetical protein FOZ63_031383 [Perkinsus olseni]
MATTLRRMFLLLLCGVNMTRGLRRRRNLEPIGADDWGDAKLSSVIRNILDGSRGAEPGRDSSPLTTFGADDGRVSGGNPVRPSEDYQAIVRDVEDALNAGDSRGIRSDDVSFALTSYEDSFSQAEPRTIVRNAECRSIVHPKKMVGSYKLPESYFHFPCVLSPARDVLSMLVASTDVRIDI